MVVGKTSQRKAYITPHAEGNCSAPETYHSTARKRVALLERQNYPGDNGSREHPHPSKGKRCECLKAISTHQHRDRLGRQARKGNTAGLSR